MSGTAFPPEGREIRQSEIRLLGSRVRIESAEESFFDQLRRCFGPSVDDLPAGHAAEADLRVRVERENGGWRFLTEPPAALGGRKPRGGCTSLLVTELNRWAVSRTTRHYVLHAGAVARCGHAILLPSASRGGKSTLTAGLIRRGFELLSDEIGAIVPSTGQLTGYPRSLSLRRDVLALMGLGTAANSDDGDACWVPVEELQGTRAKDGATLRLIVFPRFVAGRSLLERLPPGSSLAGLMETSCSQRRFKVAGMDFLLGIARKVPCYALTFSDLDWALDQIERLFTEATRNS